MASTDKAPPPDLPEQSSAKNVVYAAIAANLGIAIAKFVVAAITGSAAMLTEGIHSTVDTGNELLLLLGVRHSRMPPDEWHPFGYGKALYFWALIVALSVFSLGGGISLYHGILSLQHPAPLQPPLWNYVVLAIAAAFEAYSWNVSRLELNQHRRPQDSLWQTVRRSKDASVFTVFIEDSAALIGLAIAAAGIALGQLFDNPYFDPAASILIGVVLIASAFVLARESGNLLVGESIDRDEIHALRKLIDADHSVDSVGHLLTMQLAPQQILLTIAVRFQRGMTIGEVDCAIDRLEKIVVAQNPAIQHIFFESTSITSSFQTPP